MQLGEFSVREQQGYFKGDVGIREATRETSPHVEQDLPKPGIYERATGRGVCSLQAVAVLVQVHDECRW